MYVCMCVCVCVCVLLTSTVYTHLYGGILLGNEVLVLSLLNVEINT